MVMPKKSAADKKTFQVNTRWTASSYEMMLDKAMSRDMKVAAYLEWLVQKDRPGGRKK